MTDKQKYQGFYLLSIILGLFSIISLSMTKWLGSYLISLIMLAAGREKEKEYKKNNKTSLS